MALSAYRSFAHCSVAVAALIAAQPAEAQQRSFNVPAQDARTGIPEFARQAGIQISAPTGRIEGVRTRSVSGNLDVKDALGRLIEGTGLEVASDGGSVIILRTTGNSRGNALAGAPNAGTESVSSSGEASSGPVAEALEDYGEGEEIVVTGTNLAGVTPIGSKLTTLNRDAIERTGFSTVQDVLKTVPQVFGGGNTEDDQTDPAGLNLNAGSAINLRGLGVDSTLVLVNGRRVAPGGLNGAFVDVSSIPAAAIQRIDVLPDGASAIYGSDAVGGVVNILLRKDYKGAETGARIADYDGGSVDVRISQLAGTSWASGNVIAGYQYLFRENIDRASHKRTRSDDFSAYGGSDFRSNLSSPGNILDPATFGVAFAIPAGQDGRSLEPADLLAGATNLQESSLQADIVPEQKTHSVFASFSQNFSSAIEFLGGARFSSRKANFRSPAYSTILFVPSTNPYYVDAFGDGSDLFVTYNFINDLGPSEIRSRTNTLALDAGIRIDLGSDWKANFDATYGRERVRSDISTVSEVALSEALFDPDPATAFNPFGSGGSNSPATLATISATHRDRAKSELLQLSGIINGKLFRLPAGHARVAVGGEYRRQTFNGERRLADSSPVPKNFGRDIAAAFAEVAVPLASPEQNIPGLRSAELSGAVRYENYSDFGSSTDAKFGANWSPISPLSLRATWGTSFRAPRLIETFEDPSVGNIALLQAIQDPTDPSGFSTVLLQLGNNRDLKPETAEIWTVGFDLNFDSPRLGLSATYFNIDYSNRISRGGPPGNPFGVLLEENQWSSIVNRTPSAAQISAICNSPGFIGSVAACLASQPAALVDLRLQNLAKVEVRGIDVQLDKTWNVGPGSLVASAAGTYIFDYLIASGPSSQARNVSGDVGALPKFRGRGSLIWTNNGWTLDGTVNFLSASTDRNVFPFRKVDAWTTVDLGITYDFPRGKVLDGTRVSLRAVNLLSMIPPFANIQNAGYDTANADIYGRIVSLNITKSW